MNSFEPEVVESVECVVTSLLPPDEILVTCVNCKDEISGLTTCVCGRIRITEHSGYAIVNYIKEKC